MTTTTPPVQFMRVLSVRSRTPCVLATVGEHLVRWQSRDAWTCDCDAEDGASCEHVNVVNSMLHPNVMGGQP